MLRNLKGGLLPRLSNLAKWPSLPEKWKGGRLEKWGQFWEQVYSDYRDVAVDVVKDCRQRPLKAATITAGLGLLGYAIETNPNEQSFRELVLDCSNELALISAAVRNPASEEHVRFIFNSYNEGLIRRVSLGLLSVMWLDNYDPACSLYAAQCSYLKPQILSYPNRVLDVGLMGTWLILPRRMKDFDINPSEWADNK